MHTKAQHWQTYLFDRPTMKSSLVFRTILLMCCSLPISKVFSQQPNKIQQSIDAIKKANYCEDADYHTDGQRTVWVKSYKKWIPEDLEIMQKEAPDVLKFLGQAIKHNRFDVLEQLLPIYYRAHGGVQAFADDIMRFVKVKKPSK